MRSTESAAAALEAAVAKRSRLQTYLDVMRPDYWFKNVFMLMGTIAAVVAGQAPFDGGMVGRTILAFGLTCLAASTNYIVNEIIDAPFDRIHPVKRLRPVARGVVSVPLLLGMTAALAVMSLSGSWLLGGPKLAGSVALLLIMGVVYNVPPIRAKNVAYIDAATEAVNNPIRLLIGWYAAGAVAFPPASLVLSYWSIGAFLMTAKRFAEFRFIGEHTARAYRASFHVYTEQGLLIAMIVYVSLTTFLYGVVALKYQPELMLGLPLVLIFIAWFFRLAFEPDSIVKEPERLIRKPAFLAYCSAVLLVMIFLSSIHIPFFWWLLEHPFPQ